MIPGFGKMPCRRKWQPTPVLLPGESYGQRSLAGYSPCDCKESDTIEPLSMPHAYLREEELLVLPATLSFARGAWFCVGGVLGILPCLFVASRSSM